MQRDYVMVAEASLQSCMQLFMLQVGDMRDRVDCFDQTVIRVCRAAERRSIACLFRARKRDAVLWVRRVHGTAQPTYMSPT